MKGIDLQIQETQGTPSRTTTNNMVDDNQTAVKPMIRNKFNSSQENKDIIFNETKVKFTAHFSSEIT
jgi:hypothetical protein